MALLALTLSLSMSQSSTAQSAPAQPAPAPSDAAADAFKVVSPDGRISLNVSTAPRLLYGVSFDGKRILAPSRLGLEFKGAPAFGANLAVIKSSRHAFDETWTNPWGKSSQVRNRGVELTLDLQEKGGLRRKLGLVFRVYDDAVAFRYVLPKQPALGRFVLTRDGSEFHFDGDPAVWAADYKAFKASQESEFVKQPLSQLNRKIPSGVPVLVQVDPKAWVAIAEADLTDWAGMWVGPADRKGVLSAQLAPRPDNNGLVVSETPRSTPWRVLLISDRPGGLIESNAILNLNPPSAIPDASWIKPGLMAWDHWWHGDTKMDMETNKEYIQFAADMGWPYQLVDWHWYGKPNVPGADVTRQAPNMDIPALVEFARQRNVRLWVWTYWSDLDPKMDEAFALYEKWGLAGVKIDFMDRDDQEMVRWYEKTVRKAAAHHLMINFHGAFKGTGMNRTWPNQVTREGVMGNEYNKWSKRVTPEHKTTLPFTRYLVGPADFTPGGFINCTNDAFTTGTPAKVQGTRAAELALFVLYDSPVTCACDHPSVYKGQPGLDFLRYVPTVWDETRVLAGAPGEYIVEARRKGAEWFVGALTNSQPREIEIPLGFLAGDGYLMVQYADAPDANIDASKVLEEKRIANKADTLKVKLAPGGGVAIRFTK